MPPMPTRIRLWPGFLALVLAAQAAPVLLGALVMWPFQDEDSEGTVRLVAPAAEPGGPVLLEMRLGAERWALREEGAVAGRVLFSVTLPAGTREAVLTLRDTEGAVSDWPFAVEVLAGHACTVTLRLAPEGPSASECRDPLPGTYGGRWPH
jgi:hypothetical protein